MVYAIIQEELCEVILLKKQALHQFLTDVEIQLTDTVPVHTSIPSPILTLQDVFFTETELIMMKQRKNNFSSTAKQDFARKNPLYDSHTTLRALATVASVMLFWLLLWALVLKCSNEFLLMRNYENMKDMTVKERILWDLIPFHYRGTEAQKVQLFVDSVLNCFVFAPLGITLCYAFKRPGLWRNLAICFASSVLIELLQLVTMLGNPAPEDLITNLVGAVIGFAIYRLLLVRVPRIWCIRLLAVVNLLLVAATVVSVITTVNAADVIFKIVTRTL